jgi:hypothetical protein
VEYKKAKRRAGALFEFPVTKKFLERDRNFTGCQKHFSSPFIGCPNTGIECHGKGRERAAGEGKSVMVNNSLFPGLPTLFRKEGKKCKGKIGNSSQDLRTVHPITFVFTQPGVCVFFFFWEWNLRCGPSDGKGGGKREGGKKKKV